MYVQLINLYLYIPLWMDRQNRAYPLELSVLLVSTLVHSTILSLTHSSFVAMHSLDDLTQTYLRATNRSRTVPLV